MSRLRSVPGQIVLVLLVGVVAGVVWSLLATPAQWQAVGGQLQLTEDSSKARFGVVLTFVAVGAVASLLWSMLATAMLGASWQSVVVVVLGSLVAALTAWQVGMVLGPPDPSTVAGLAEGDFVDDRLVVDSLAAFVIWPISALVGVLLVTWSGRDDRDQREADQERAIADTTARVDDTRS